MNWFIGDPDDPNDSFVYFLRGNTGAIKIGRSQHPRRRFLKIGRQFPIDEIMLVYHAPLTEERRLHQAFHQHRLVNEWFAPARPVLRYVETFDRAVVRYINGAAWHPNGHFVRGPFMSLPDIDEGRASEPQPVETLQRLLGTRRLNQDVDSPITEPRSQR